MSKEGYVTISDHLGHDIHVRRFKNSVHLRCRTCKMSLIKLNLGNTSGYIGAKHLLKHLSHEITVVEKGGDAVIKCMDCSEFI